MNQLWQIKGRKLVYTEQEMTLIHAEYNKWLDPRIEAIGELENLHGRFDQCVISRGADMRSHLEEIQGALYIAWSRLLVLYPPSEHRNKAFTERVNRIVGSRILAYRRLVNNTPGAYEDLLALAGEFKGAARLVQMALDIDRGGRVPDKILDKIGPILYQAKQDNPLLSWASIGNKGVTTLRKEHDLQAAQRIEYERDRDDLSNRRHYPNWVKDQVERWEKKIGGGKTGSSLLSES